VHRGDRRWSLRARPDAQCQRIGSLNRGIEEDGEREARVAGAARLRSLLPAGAPVLRCSQAARRSYR
jgi:hypothetical protein